MKSKISKLLGLLFYFLVMGKLMDFNWTSLIKLKPLASVIVGMLILTLSQYKKGCIREAFLSSAKWNVLFASFLTTLMSILSFVSTQSIGSLGFAGLAEHMLPLIYGSILYLIMNLIYDTDNPIQDRPLEPTVTEVPTSLVSAEQVFRDLGLTNRECHVAIKLLENISNKEIGEQLYISEATVKKHIQNIYQKLQATDRNSFREIYYQNTKNYA